MMMMKVLCLIIFVASITAIHAAANADLLITLNEPDLIESTCNRCAETSMATLPFCLSSLKDKPITAKIKDLNLLGFLAMVLVRENATSAAATIQAMLDSGSVTDPSIEHGLNSCLREYNGAIKEAEDAISYSLNDQFEAAGSCMAMVQLAAISCEFKFDDEYSSPIATETKKLWELSGVAKCIAKLVAG